MELRVTNSVQPYPLLTMTTVTTVTTCTHCADGDPKMPIPVPHGADVELDELITELSVPIPHIRHHPYIGIGDRMNYGGVTTSGFRVREEPMQTREAYQKTQRVGNFQRSGPLLGVRAERIRKQGRSERHGCTYSQTSLIRAVKIQTVPITRKCPQLGNTTVFWSHPFSC